MFCSNCGATLREDSAFCSKCGSALQSKIFCAKCGTELEAGDGFCFACGAPVKKASENPVSSKSAAITDPSTPKSPSAKKISSKKVNSPGVDTCVYSAWNTFQNWENNYCVAAGCDGYHFIRGHIGFWGESENRIIRVEEKGINGIAFELPFEVKYLFGEGGRLWMTEKNYEPDVNPVYRIWSMDPETLEYKIEYDLSEFASKYYFNKPFITTSSIYIPANKEMDHDELLCLDRVTNKIRPIFVSEEKNDSLYGFRIEISSISDNVVLIQDDYGDHEIHDRVVVDNTGKKVLLRNYPGIKEMIPILLKLSNRSLPLREDYDPDIYDDPDKKYKKDYLDCINSVLENIIYIDFSDQNIYFCPDSWSSNESLVKHKQYCIPFGATNVDEAVAYWEEPNDFSLAGESRYGSRNVELETYILFDGKNAVGCSSAGTHRPRCLQTAKGKMINFNQNGQSKLDEVSTYAALIGDWLYLFDAEDGRRYYAKFHLGDSVPVEQKIEIIEK